MSKERKLLLEGVLGFVVPVLAVAALLVAAYVMEQGDEGVSRLTE